MPVTYKLFTAIVALIGNCSLVLTGELNPAFSFVGLGLLWGHYRSLRGMPQFPKRLAGGLSLLTFIIFLADFFSTGDMINAVAHMSLVFQAIKSFDIKDPWDPPQVFFMSLLQLLLASELTSSIYFGVMFIVFLVSIVVAVLLGHFVKEGQMTFRPYLRPIGAVTVVIVVLTAIFFVSLPRLRSSIWGKSYSRSLRTTGFSEKVDFGSFGAIKLDRTIVIRMVLVPDSKGPHYLRGSTFDNFDGTAWYDTIKETVETYRRASYFSETVPEDEKKYDALIFVEPLDSDIIFTYKMPYKLEAPGWFIRRSSAGSFSMRRKISKRFNYKLSSIDGHYDDSSHLDRYLQYPSGLDRVKDLAAIIASGAGSDLEASTRIMDHLKTSYGYSLFSDVPDEGSNAIEHFLFRSKRGYCEHFATAMTIMLRARGIPARLVTGYLTDSRNDIGGYYLIRQSDAHSWVEAFIGGKWIRMDPTPPVTTTARSGIMLLLDLINMNWNRYIVGFSDYDQKSLVRYFGVSGQRRAAGRGPGAGSIAFAGLLLALAATAIILIRRYSRRSAAKNGIVSGYMRFRVLVAKHGGRVTDASTSEDVRRAAIDDGNFDADKVDRFISAYRRSRFSGIKDDALDNDYSEALRKVMER